MAQEFVCEVAVPRSRCVYCGSVNYGKGCHFGPKGVHFHADDIKKCSYCGSPNFGKGCNLNPFEKMHVHGIPFNSMLNKEEIDATFTNWSLVEELNKPIKEFKAYQLGLINENGDLIKEVETPEEFSAYNTEIRTILKIRKYLGAKVGIIKQTALLENESQYLTESTREGLKKHLELEDKINDIYNQFCQVLTEARHEGFSLEQIRSLIVK